VTATAAEEHRSRAGLREWWTPVAVWATSRLLIGTIAVVSQWFQPGHGVLTNADWPPRLLFQWDSGYFLAIAAHGYAGSPESLQAFFPGYPLLSRALALPFSSGHPSTETLIVSMFVVVQMSALLAAVVVWQLVRRDHSATAATVSVAMLLMGPYAVFLAASYSEALFLAAASAAWLLARRRHWLGAGLAGAAASFTRVNGLFVVAALVVMYLIDRRQSGRRLLSPHLVGVLTGLAGAAAYWVYLLILTGSPIAWSRAQAEGWNRGFQWPWVTFYNTAGRVLFASTWDRRIQYGLDIVFAAALIVAIVWFIRRRRWPEAVLLGLTALSLMTSFSYLSLARNTSTLFPVAIALGVAAVESPRRRWLAIGVGVVGILLLAFTTHQFSIGLWSD
jgi:Gpi18-like mannosyltransferase